ncbi:MAG TPA: polyprenyl diphosphate synthase [Thiobacillaceae bacterium]|nr:polyprenyl diphosphate synthase [Thiobacillaceae bacterium]
MIRKFFSSTSDIPESAAVPRHIAIIMDGNGRWAKKRLMPRVAGHVQGVERVRDTVQACIERGVEYLTLFAFSSENWRRPQEEVSKLMELFILALEREVEKLNRNGIRLKIVGDLERFDSRLRQLIRDGEARTADKDRLTLTIAANYGGRWDILNAVNTWLAENPGSARMDEAAMNAHLALPFAPEPDLFIRTGGEQRISNFLLWQLAYTELYFTDTLWPDFSAGELDRAITWYQQRERRFGRTSEQVRQH